MADSATLEEMNLRQVAMNTAIRTHGAGTCDLDHAKMVLKVSAMYLKFLRADDLNQENTDGQTTGTDAGAVSTQTVAGA